MLIIEYTNLKQMIFALFKLLIVSIGLIDYKSFAIIRMLIRFQALEEKALG